MKKLVLLFLLLTSPFLFSQNKFQKGYFIDNNNAITECLIKNVDWLNNPSTFEYKTDESALVQERNILNTKYFEIEGASKYIREQVKLDMSSNYIDNLSTTRQPEFVDKVIFLKEIVSGTASLYLYREGNLVRFFYKTQGADIEPLIYKKYLITHDKIGQNLDYQQTLLNKFVCDNISQHDITLTNYDQKKLTKLFVKYNSCISPNQESVVSNTKKGEFNITIRPRINFSKASFTRAGTPYDFGKKNIVGIGIDLEYVLPFNNKKWSVFADPNYIDVKNSTNVYKNEIDLMYKAIEVPIGIRYGIFLSENSKLYLNAAYVIDINLNSKLTKDNADFIDIKSLPNFAFGLGYKFKDRYSIELRSTTSKSLTKNYMYWTSEFTNTSIIFGYRIF